MRERKRREREHRKQGLNLIEPAAYMEFGDMARRPRGSQCHGILDHSVFSERMNHTVSGESDLNHRLVIVFFEGDGVISINDEINYLLLK